MPVHCLQGMSCHSEWEFKELPESLGFCNYLSKVSSILNATESLPSSNQLIRRVWQNRFSDRKGFFGMQFQALHLWWRLMATCQLMNLHSREHVHWETWDWMGLRDPSLHSNFSAYHLCLWTDYFVVADLATSSRHVDFAILHISILETIKALKEKKGTRTVPLDSILENSALFDKSSGFHCLLSGGVLAKWYAGPLNHHA